VGYLEEAIRGLTIMNFLVALGCLIVIFAAAIYISKAWAEAKHRRDCDFAIRPGAGIVENERKPSALPYLFK